MSKRPSDKSGLTEIWGPGLSALVEAGEFLGYVKVLYQHSGETNSGSDIGRRLRGRTEAEIQEQAVWAFRLVRSSVGEMSTGARLEGAPGPNLDDWKAAERHCQMIKAMLEAGSYGYRLRDLAQELVRIIWNILMGESEAAMKIGVTW